MAFRHRKLGNETYIDPIKFCEDNCDLIKKPYSICTETCLWCPPACENPPPEVAFAAPPGHPRRISLLLTVSLAALAAVFFLFTCYTIYKFYANWCSPGSRRRRSRRRGEGGGGGDPDEFLDQEPAVDHHVWFIRTIGLQPSVIGAITIVRYRKGEGLIDGSDCSVCLSEFQEGETLRLLPKCNHAFHVACIDTWLGSHTNCPMCRAGIVNSSAHSPPQDQIVHGPGPVEEGASGAGRGAGRDSENQPNEPMVGNGDSMVSRAMAVLKIDRGGLLDGIQVQPLRRSISVDSLSAVGKSDDQLVPVKDCESGVVAGRRAGFNQGLLRLIGSPSIRTGSPNSMKRSRSCSANVLLSKHSSRNRT